MSANGTWKFFLSADWGKDAEKRSVYLVDRGQRSIRRCDCNEWSLGSLLDRAEELMKVGPVLVGIDAAFGVPRGYWDLVRANEAWKKPESFIEWFARLGLDSEFFEAVERAEDWRVYQPFFRVPAGTGGLTSFAEIVEGGLLRRIDAATGGKPLFATSGIPGTVGSGTRAVWRELLAEVNGGREVALWPFNGSLSELFEHPRVVVAETYPRLAYAVTLAGQLPTNRLNVGKTKVDQRARFCRELGHAAWVEKYEVDLGDLDSCCENEDDFDAHVTAAAVLRCILEDAELCQADWVDDVAEGGMLLAGAVDLNRQSRNYASKRSLAEDRLGHLPKSRPASRKEAGKTEHPCPILGCTKVFVGSRRGWDGHVGSISVHGDWHPEVELPKKRRQLFREEFASWFR